MPRPWARPGPDQSRRDGTHSGPQGGLWPPSSLFVLQTPAGTSLAKPHPLYEKTTKAAPPLCLSLSTPGPHRGVKAKGPLLRVLCQTQGQQTPACLGLL